MNIYLILILILVIVQKKKKCVDEVLFGYKLFSRKQMYAKSHRAHW